MDSKFLAGIEIKDETKGEVEAVFATLGVVDKDNDVTKSGAFDEGSEVVISSYNHKSWEGALPVGKGTIHEVGNKVLLKGQFFLNTTQGRDTFEVVKQLGARQEWSYGFKVEDSEEGDFEGKSVRYLKKMSVFEVSPVMRGAGVGTQTTYAKADLSASGRRREAASGAAMSDGSFPIQNRHDLENAIHDVGRAKDPAAAKRHIIERARALGCMDALPTGWGKSLNEEISFAVEAVEAAVESAERVAALRAEQGKELSNIVKAGLADLDEAILRITALLMPETKTEDKTDYNAELRKAYLASVAANYTEGN